MSTENPSTPATDNTNVDVNNKIQLEQIAAQLQTTVKDVEEAVKAVGVLFKDIKEFIEEHKRHHKK